MRSTPYMGTYDRGTYDTVEFSKKLASKSRLHITNSVRPMNFDFCSKAMDSANDFRQKIKYPLRTEFEKIPILFT